MAEHAMATLLPSHRVVEFERQVDVARRSSIGATPPAVSTRWLVARAAISQIVTSLVSEWSVPGLLGSEQPGGDELGRGDVLDGKANRLEDGDGVRVASVRPVTADRADFDQVRFRH
jgi:hypothetical protein